MAIHLITLSALVLAVLLVRAVFRKRVPARLIYALWLVVAVKMCMPFSLFAVELPMPFYTAVVQTQNIPAETREPEVTVGAPITPIVPQQPIASQESADLPTVPAAPMTPVRPAVTEPAVVTPIETEVVVPEQPAVVEKEPVDWVHIVQIVWFVGSAVAAVWFAVTGTVFYQKLCADRRLHITVGRTKVYISQSAGAPCLAGLIPAIYLTPSAANAPMQNFVIAHEYTHLRHGDHIWSILRTLALVVYWWNPFVWAAAFVSRQDAELACDEAVAAKLDDVGRIAYARTILDTIPQKYAHAVGLASAPIKERVLMLTSKHRNRAIAAILAVVLTLSAVGCSFIGPKETTEPVDDIPDLPGSITTTREPGDTPDIPSNVDSPVRVLSNAGNLSVHSVALPLENENYRYVSFAFNDRYSIYLTYEIVESAWLGVNNYCYDTLYIVDALGGMVVHKYAVDRSANIAKITYTENGCTVYALQQDKDGQTRTVEFGYSITESGGVFTVLPYTPSQYPMHTQRVVSPDGNRVAYQTEDDTIGHGGIDITYYGNTAKRILENVCYDIDHGGTVSDISDVRIYMPVGFIDDTHLGYTIYGWEHFFGYGIYDVVTDEKIEMYGTYVARTVQNGSMYVEERRRLEDGVTVFSKLWTVTVDGTQTLLASVDENDSTDPLPQDISFKGSGWYDAKNAEKNIIVSLYSLALDRALCEIEYPYETRDYRLENLMFYGDTVTVVVPTVYTMSENGITIHSLADWDILNFDGAFPKTGNYYAMINGLVHFEDAYDLADRYPEFETVKISSYTVSRKGDDYWLQFHFTVAASGLATLPVGTYQTTVGPNGDAWKNDARMTIYACDAVGRIASVQTDRKSVEYLSAWMDCTDAWDLPEYGTLDTYGDTSTAQRYLSYVYAGSYTPKEYAALMMNIFGVEIFENAPSLQERIGDDGKIKLSALHAPSDMVYDVISLITEGDTDILTVQHYNDINKLIPSILVEYRIGEGGRLYGCELIKDAGYRPLHSQYARYTYQGWKPLTDVYSIHSLADWDILNFDGEFSADGNCYALINGLVHFGGGG